MKKCGAGVGCCGDAAIYKSTSEGETLAVLPHHTCIPPRRSASIDRTLHSNFAPKMGPHQPFIYNPPSNVSNYGFDPKPYTRASMVPPVQRRPKSHQEGPLVDFNRHPDSWPMPPYGQTNAMPMHPNTKRNIKISRGIQLGLRILTMIGALGALICVICLNGTQGTETWLIRVPVSCENAILDFFARLTGSSPLWTFSLPATHCIT